jgi:putative transcriptional regulator
LEAIARGKGPKRFLVALGYAGWSAGQLEEEIRANAWLNASAHSELLWSTPVDRRWQDAVARTGVDLTRLSSVSGHG